MDRLLTSKLVSWKNQENRKPVLLDGARQVGKSYLIERCFGEVHFRQVHKLDFLTSPDLANIFEASLKPLELLNAIQITLDTEIDPLQDLIFFDEIVECQNALNALKFIAEDCPDWFVCSSGSNIGLIDSFPVGKVDILELFPMCFEEFLMAAGSAILLQNYQQMSRLKVVHDKLWPLMLDYYFVGGMPEAVNAWQNAENLGVIEKSEKVSSIHRSLIAGYQKDFGKYSGKVNAQHIEKIFSNIPAQLSQNIDGSVKRYRFGGIIEKRKGYMDLHGPIDWLEKTRLISKCYSITVEPASPLAAYKKESLFKLFFFDVGLLGHMLGLSYAEHQAQTFTYKGYLAENFVQNELRVIGYYPSYSWNVKEAEVEFLYKSSAGDIIPVEVKSGKRTKAKSLQSYIKRYNPAKTLKLIGSVGGSADADGVNLVWPLYYAARVIDL